MKDDENMENQTDILGWAGIICLGDQKSGIIKMLSSRNNCVYLYFYRIDHFRTVPRLLEILSCNLSKTLYSQSFNLLNVAINNKRGTGVTGKNVSIPNTGESEQSCPADNIKLASLK